MPTKKDKSKITDELDRLNKIVEWFESREEIDVEEGLNRVKEGSEIIKRLKSRIKDVENEFELVKKDLNIG